MSSFVRPSDWLRQLFTASRTAHVHPSKVSNDVSLVSDYAGGGWGMVDPESTVVQVTSAALATGSMQIIAAGANEIVRILAISANLGAGVAPFCNIFARPPVALQAVYLHTGLTLLAADSQAFVPLSTPLILPTFTLNIFWSGGDAATVVQCQCMFVRMPLGTAPCL